MKTICNNQPLFLVGGTPGVFETPISHETGERNLTDSSSEASFSNSELKDEAPNMSLDKFLAKNTSEDNASFERIMEESKQRLRQKYSWLFDKEDEQTVKQDETLSLPSCEDQMKYCIEDKPANVDTWTYKTRNALMYVPEGAELSAKEILDAKSKKDRVIRHENTRFSSDPFDSVSCKRAMSESARQNANMKKQMGKIGSDGALETPSDTPTVRGYGFVATPSPAPGNFSFSFNLACSKTAFLFFPAVFSIAINNFCICCVLPSPVSLPCFALSFISCRVPSFRSLILPPFHR